MKIFALLSDERVHKSLSPMMHNRVFCGRGLGAEYNYIPLEIAEEDFAEAIAGLRALNIAGVNVTVPYKEKIIPYLDSVSEQATLAGAVNTVIRDGDQLRGDNTDIGGFLDALRINHISATGKNVILTGNGGAARGLLVALKEAGAARITILGRSLVKAGALAEEFEVGAGKLDDIADYLIESDILVNTAAVSTAEEAPELAEAVAEADTGSLICVVDINYGRERNIWQQLAVRAGAEFIDGLPMLALQARRSLELWTGVEATEKEYLTALGL